MKIHLLLKYGFLLIVIILPFPTKRENDQSYTCNLLCRFRFSLDNSYFTFAGCILMYWCRITSDGRSKGEILKRINHTKTIFKRTHNLFISSSIVYTGISENWLKSFVWCVIVWLHYGLVGEAERKKITAFELSCCRGMCRISESYEHRGTKAIWIGKDVEPNLQGNGCLNWSCSKTRSTAEDNSRRSCEGRNARGRRRLQYIDQLMKDTGCQILQNSGETSSCHYKPILGLISREDSMVYKILYYKFCVLFLIL